MTDASLSLLLTKPVCVVPREVAPRGWRHLHSSVETMDSHPPLRPKRLFVQGRALAFVAASHLNDKDPLEGRAPVAQSPVMLCPPDRLWWARETDRGSSVSPHQGAEGGRSSSFLWVCPMSPR